MARRAGLYLLGGFGARGLTFSPLLGEALAAEMCGEPSPLAQGWRAALDPARFLRRALRRHKPDPV
jgi:tRNA 5-methylaminomethyl-2-thiouridine biosynthesis bifunctional protein